MTRLAIGLALVAIATIAISVTARNDYSPAALADEIKVLPGAPAVGFRQFSGYIPVNAAGTRKIFYYFVESVSGGQNDPVIWWTNGGPGCSGLLAAFTEHGPFQIQADKTLKQREHAWNRAASIIYVEQPAGVGFSIPEQAGLQLGDEQSATDNWQFVVNWFKRFNNYQNQPFFISSESYGGHYVPTLALKLVQTPPLNVSFQGFLVGNPLTYMPFRDFGEFGTFAGHNMVPKPEFDRYLAAGCEPDPAAPATNPPPPRPQVCATLESSWSDAVSGTDPYALDFPVCASSSTGRGERALFMRRVNKAKRAAASNYKLNATHNVRALVRDAPEGYFPADYEPCADDWLTAWLNQPAVQSALHTLKPYFGQWQECAPVQYSDYDMITAMMPVYQQLYTLQPKLKMMVYSGDDDSVCATLGSQHWIWNLGRTVVEPWQSWHVATPQGQQLAGWRVRFAGLHFVTVHGAGHMAPATRPSQTFQGLLNFLSDSWA